MWRKGKPFALLVGTQIGAAIVESSMEIPQKIKNALAGVAQWIECQVTNQRVVGWIPSQGTCLDLG